MPYHYRTTLGTAARTAGRRALQGTTFALLVGLLAVLALLLAGCTSPTAPTAPPTAAGVTPTLPPVTVALCPVPPTLHNVPATTPQGGLVWVCSTQPRPYTTAAGVTTLEVDYYVQPEQCPATPIQ